MKPWAYTLILLVVGGFFGYLGNVYANRKNNQELIALLKADQLVVKARLQGERLSNAETAALNLKNDALQKQIDRINKMNLNLL